MQCRAYDYRVVDDKTGEILDSCRYSKKDARETAKSLDKARELSPKRNIKNSLARNLILVLKLIQKLVKFIEMIEQKILKTLKGLLRKCGSPFFALLNIENMIYR